MVAALNVDQGETGMIGTMDIPGSVLPVVTDLSEMLAKMMAKMMAEIEVAEVGCSSRTPRCGPP